MATLDGLIHDVGSCGVFQTLLLIFVHATNSLAAWGMMFMVFGGYDPGWECLDESTNQRMLGLNMSTTAAAASTPPTQSVDNVTLEHCELFRSCSNVSFNPESSTLVTEWNLLCEDKWIPKTITTIQMIGVLVGSYITGHLGDCVGRKLSLYGMVAFHAVANFAAVFSTSWQVFAAVRFFIGFAVGGILIAMATLPIEFLNQFWRGVDGALPTWNTGSTLFSLAVMLLRDWRQLHLLTAALSVLLFLPVFWVPESLRWLAVHGRDKQAESVARRIAKINGRPNPSPKLLARVAEAERRRANSSRGYSYLDLFIRGGRRVRKHTIFMGFIWVGMAFVYYGLSFGIQAISGDFYINFVLFSVAEILGCILVVPAIHFFGRRWGSAAHFIVASVACFAVIPVTLLMGNTSNQKGEETNKEELLKGRLIMAFAFISKMMIVGAWSAISVFGGELFPTVVRSLAIGFCSAAARIGGMLGPVLFPQEPDLLYIGLTATGCLTLLCTGLVLLLPETKGMALEDTLAGEGEDGMTKTHYDQSASEEENCELDDIVNGNADSIGVKIER